MNSLLVIGGARSGKSHYAEMRLEALPGRLAYIATAEPGDDEMRERIAHHKARRGSRWRTVEAPLALPEALGAVAGECDAVLIDCLTLWLSNLLLAGRDIGAARQALCDAIVGCPAPLAVIANEVGLGIVPDNVLARRFRDEAGWLNQQVASVVEEVVMVAAGLPLILKSGRTRRLDDERSGSFGQ